MFVTFSLQIIKLKQMNRFSIVVFLILFSKFAIAQTLTIDLGVGVNIPSDDFGVGYEAKPINGPTVDAGIRYMFKKKLGAKIDLGFNRYGEGADSPEFKANFTRVNLQAYYNVWDLLYDLQLRLPERIGVFVHAGPGMSFVKPLSEPYINNKSSNFNAIAGVAVHYGISDKVSVYADTSNIFNMGQKTNYEGSLLADKINASMLTVTFGVSISINSDCYFCEKPEL